MGGLIRSRDARFGLSTIVLNAVVRITTNGRIFKSPSSVREAFDFCENLLAQPNCDAWLAALAIESGSQWITLDRDFARFQGLDWRVPAI